MSPCSSPPELTSRSLPDIGRRFGGRDHTTVLHGCRRIEELRQTDMVLQQEVDFLRNLLGRPAKNSGKAPFLERGRS
jgi:hypothetical protein